MNSRDDGIDELKQGIREFAKERDWDKYHSPKNLSMALAVEAAELMEIFNGYRQRSPGSLMPLTSSGLRKRSAMF
jgi:NTP pyrophosphatase (non-canonical NTP hydrolase)